jgi:hypothetical protein
MNVSLPQFARTALCAFAFSAYPLAAQAQFGAGIDEST